jgi:tRNA pseudouridine synthase 10
MLYLLIHHFGMFQLFFLLYFYTYLINFGLKNDFLITRFKITLFILPRMNIRLTDKKIINNAEKAILNYDLCNHCLGRIFAKIGHGLTNRERGLVLKNQFKIKKNVDVNSCWLCNGLLGEILHFSNLIKNSLNDYEYETFLIGSKVDEDILDREQELFKFVDAEYSESIKNEINREIGKILEKNLKKEVDFKKPTIMAVVDTSFDFVNLQISSLFIYGRYKKFKRDIPQTKWFCKICYGKGCKRCNYSGKLYDTSVEELVADKFLEKTKGEDESFHGCGREDVDARMLGNGRPFVLEIKNPKLRDLNLVQLEKEINKINKEIIEITNLRYSNRSEISRLKHSGFSKIYRVVIKSKKILNNEKLKKAAISLCGKKIGQFTPSRVAHRRAKMIREKHIYDCKIESESGTYIKELISGDEGKTKPNLSDLIGIPCQVTELDVINIKGE